MAEYNLGTAHGTVKIDSDTSGVDKADQALGNLKKSGESTGEALSTVGNTMGVAGTVIAGGLGVAVKTAADFEQGLSGIRAVSGASAAEMDKVRDAALRIGKDTAFSATEASAAMEELVKAGIPVEDVLNGAADATVALAAATGVDMPTAASIASNAMNVFGIAADDMDRVVNTFAQTANASAIDVTDLGMSMQQVGAVADLAGLSMEDTTKAIGQLGDAGIKGSDAGTSLKTMLMNLQPSTEKAAGTFRDLGIITEDGTNKFYDQEGRLKSLRDVQEILHDATDGMGAAQKQAALETMFGSDAIRAAAILAEGGAESYDAFGNKMTESGTAAEQAKIRQENLAGSFEQFKGALETAAIIIGTVLIPPLTDLVNWLGSLFDKFAELSPGQQKFITYLAAGAAALLLMGAGVIKAVQFYQKLSGAISTIIGALFRKNAAETASAASSSRSALASAGAWIAHAGRMAAIWASMAAQATANAIRTGAVWLAETARATVTMAAQWAAAAARAVASWVMMGIRAAAQAAIVAGAWLVSAGTSMATAVASTAVAVASVVAGWVMMGVQSMIRAAQMAAAWIIAMGPVGWIIAAVIALVALIIANWDTVKAWTIAAWNAIWGAIQAAWEWIKNIVSAAINFVLGLVTSIWNTIQAISSAVWNAILAVISFVWNAIVTAVTTYINTVLAIINAVWNTIKAVTSAVWNGIQAVLSAVWNTIKSLVTGAINTVKSIITGAWNTIQSITSGVWNTIRNLLSSAWDGIKSAISGGVSSILSTIGSLPGRILGALGDLGSLLVGVGKKLIQGLINGITNMFGSVKDTLGGLTSKLTSWKGPPKRDASLLTGAGQLIIGGLIRGLESQYGAVRKSLTGLTDDVASTQFESLNAAINANLTPGSLAGLQSSALPGGSPAASMVAGRRASSSRAATDAEFKRIVEMNFNTYNPVAEKASDSEARRIRAASAMGAF